MSNLIPGGDELFGLMREIRRYTLAGDHETADVKRDDVLKKALELIAEAPHTAGKLDMQLLARYALRVDDANYMRTLG